METIALIADMFRHMAWADGMVFTSVIGKSVAEGDASVLVKLRHLHMVQKVFLDVFNGVPFDPRATDELDLHSLCGFARNTHAGSMGYLDSLSPVTLEEVLELPWSKTATEKLGFEVADHSLADALVQVPAHSSYHRGQVCARLRELGIDPPMTDYIAWIWRHKPEPSWPE